MRLHLRKRSEAITRVQAIRANLREVVNAVHMGTQDELDPEVIIELRGDLEQLLELIGRAEG